jgi:hypothetical protein|tara:strand:+ start:562 stop:711 length:150 start_codon:yes stop_codon:yes gene_type:complete
MPINLSPAVKEKLDAYIASNPTPPNPETELAEVLAKHTELIEEQSNENK